MVCPVGQGPRFVASSSRLFAGHRVLDDGKNSVQVDDAKIKASFAVCLAQDAGGVNLVQADVAKMKGVTVDGFSNDTLDFAWNGTQKGFATEALARAAFVTALSKVAFSPF